MKLIYRFFVVLILFVGVTSCDDEPVGDSYADSGPINAEFKAEFEGEGTFIGHNSGVLTEDGVTQIVGKRNDGVRVSMKFNGSGTGTYVLDGTPDGNAIVSDGADEPYTMEDVDTVGVVNITKYDVNSGVASGTFSFKVKRDSVTIPNDSTEVPSDSTENGMSFGNITLDDDNGGFNMDDFDDIDEDDINDMLDSLEGEEPEEPEMEEPEPGETQIFSSGTLNVIEGEFTDIQLNSDVAPPPEEVEAAFEVELDEELYVGENIHGSLNEDGALSIDTENNPQQFELSVADLQEGNYTLGPDDEATIFYNPDNIENDEGTYEASEGTVSITNIDQENETVSGVFSGALISLDDDSTIEMTNGKFENISYGTGGGGSGTNFITANVDGDNFESNSISSTEGDGVGISAVIGTDDENNDIQLQLNMPYSASTGSHQVITGGVYSAAYHITDENGETVEYETFNNSGSIVIDERDEDNVTGTFSFSVRNDDGEVLQITDGEFDVNLE